MARHGTTDLLAALNIAIGKVISKLSAQHRAVDFRDFLDRIDRQADPGLAVHVICDNQVERWFVKLQRGCLERGVFCALDALTTALENWIKIWNEDARPFTWTKTADQIIDRICRYYARISGPGH